MRLLLAAAVGLFLAGGSAYAAPQFAPSKTEVGTTSSLQLARAGCGVGWHRHPWRDRSGRWHRGCVPNH